MYAFVLNIQLVLDDDIRIFGYRDKFPETHLKLW